MAGNQFEINPSELRAQYMQYHTCSKIQGKEMRRRETNTVYQSTLNGCGLQAPGRRGCCSTPGKPLEIVMIPPKGLKLW